MATLKGLSHRFTVVNGRFQFTEGVEKAGDDVRFMLGFYARNRIYAPDFSPGLLWVIQRPLSVVDVYATLILGRLKKSFARYLPQVKITGLDLARSTERNAYALSVAYTYNESPEETTVQFL